VNGPFPGNTPGLFRLFQRGKRQGAVRQGWFEPMFISGAVARVSLDNRHTVRIFGDVCRLFGSKAAMQILLCEGPVALRLRLSPGLPLSREAARRPPAGNLRLPVTRFAVVYPNTALSAMPWTPSTAKLTYN
jgi:hypothetical protein